jgi:hypothetical protein
MSLRDELLAAWEAEDAQPLTAVEIKGWPKIYVRSMTVAEVDAQQAVDGGWKKDAKLSIGTATVICDEKGNRLFDPDNEADVKRIGTRSWAKISKALSAAKIDEGTDAGK